MNRQPLPLLAFSLVLALLVVAVAPSKRDAHAQLPAPLVVIMASNAPISDISSNTLRRAFRSEIAEYHDGKRLVAFNLPNESPDRQLFDELVMGLSPADVGRFWIDRRIRDEGAPPRTAPNAELLLRVVSAFPGAIGYLRANLLTPKVRALSIDGKRAGSPDYLLSR